MNVLVACEEWGIVRDAFIEAGHDAISCDLNPTRSPGPHHQGDVRPLLRESWDLVIAHPPCTFLTNARGKIRDLAKAAEAIDFFVECYRANAPMVAVENPLPYKFVRRFIGEATQTVQPFEFGDPWRKRTLFWLKGLPILLPTVHGYDESFQIRSRTSSGQAHRRGEST